MPGTIRPYCQSFEVLWRIGRIWYAMRGPRSRAWFMANPVVPPMPMPTAHTMMPTPMGSSDS